MDMAAGRFHAYASNTNSVGYRKKKRNRRKLKIDGIKIYCTYV